MLPRNGEKKKESNTRQEVESDGLFESESTRGDVLHMRLSFRQRYISVKNTGQFSSGNACEYFLKSLS